MGKNREEHPKNKVLNFFYIFDLKCRSREKATTVLAGTTTKSFVKVLTTIIYAYIKGPEQDLSKKGTLPQKCF